MEWLDWFCFASALEGNVIKQTIFKFKNISQYTFTSSSNIGIVNVSHVICIGSDYCVQIHKQKENKMGSCISFYPSLCTC